MHTQQDLLGNDFRLDGSVVGIGVFDGLHRGHQRLIDLVLTQAGEEGLPSVLLTFDPHPREVLSASRPPGTIPPPPLRLSSIPDMEPLLVDRGLDHLLIVNFTPEFSRWSPSEFVERILMDRLKACRVVVGFNFSFGEGGQGNAGTLRDLGEIHGFALTRLEPVRWGDRIVSSSTIRDGLAGGHVLEVARLLGRPFTLRAPVVTGDGRGRTIGFPTANLDIDTTRQAVPGRGVYRVEARLEGGPPVPGLANIGVNPTFIDQPDPPLKVEVHLLDFDEDLVGRELRVAFLDRIRDEKRFADREALVRQIRADVESLRQRLEEVGA